MGRLLQILLLRAGLRMRQDFPFSIFGLALRLYEHAARGVPARSTATSIFLCLLKLSIFSDLFWWQWTYKRISAAIFLVAMNLHSNSFQPPLWWWHCRICQVAI